MCVHLSVRCCSGVLLVRPVERKHATEPAVPQRDLRDLLGQPCQRVRRRVRELGVEEGHNSLLPVTTTTTAVIVILRCTDDIAEVVHSVQVGRTLCTEHFSGRRLCEGVNKAPVVRRKGRFHGSRTVRGLCEGRGLCGGEGPPDALGDDERWADGAGDEGGRLEAVLREPLEGSKEACAADCLHEELRELGEGPVELDGQLEQLLELVGQRLGPEAGLPRGEELVEQADGPRDIPVQVLADVRLEVAEEKGGKGLDVVVAPEQQLQLLEAAGPDLHEAFACGLLEHPLQEPHTLHRLELLLVYALGPFWVLPDLLHEVVHRVV